MRAESLPQPFVTAFAEQVHIHVADGGQVTVRIVGHHHGTVFVFGADAVVRHTIAVIVPNRLDEGYEHAIEFMNRLGLGVLRDDRHGFR